MPSLARPMLLPSPRMLVLALRALKNENVRLGTSWAIWARLVVLVLASSPVTRGHHDLGQLRRDGGVGGRVSGERAAAQAGQGRRHRDDGQ